MLLASIAVQATARRAGVLPRPGARHRRCRCATYFVLIPIVVVMQLPITVSGLGTSQARSSCSSAGPAWRRRRRSRSPSSSSRSASSATCRAHALRRRQRRAIAAGIDAHDAVRVLLAVTGLPCSPRSGSRPASAALLYAVIYLARGASGPAARHRAVRPAPSRRMDRRGAARLRPDAARPLGRDRRAHRVSGASSLAWLAASAG